jgi:hypothetical protein
MAGVAVAGANNVVQSCDFSNNGGYVSPGPGQHRNLQMKYVSGVQVDDNRLDGSIAGCGLHIRSGSRISVTGTEAARNPQAGMRFVDCTRVSVEHPVAEGNDQQGLISPLRAPISNRLLQVKIAFNSMDQICCANAA